MIPRSVDGACVPKMMLLSRAGSSGSGVGTSCICRQWQSGLALLLARSLRCEVIAPLCFHKNCSNREVFSELGGVKLTSVSEECSVYSSRENSHF